MFIYLYLKHGSLLYVLFGCLWTSSGINKDISREKWKPEWPEGRRLWDIEVVSCLIWRVSSFWLFLHQRSQRSKIWQFYTFHLRGKCEEEFWTPAASTPPLKYPHVLMEDRQQPGLISDTRDHSINADPKWESEKGEREIYLSLSKVESDTNPASLIRREGCAELGQRSNCCRLMGGHVRTPRPGGGHISKSSADETSRPPRGLIPVHSWHVLPVWEAGGVEKRWRDGKKQGDVPSRRVAPEPSQTIQSQMVGDPGQLVMDRNKSPEKQWRIYSGRHTHDVCVSFNTNAGAEKHFFTLDSWFLCLSTRYLTG